MPTHSSGATGLRVLAPGISRTVARSARNKPHLQLGFVIAQLFKKGASRIIFQAVYLTIGAEVPKGRSRPWAVCRVYIQLKRGSGRGYKCSAQLSQWLT